MITKEILNSYSLTQLGGFCDLSSPTEVTEYFQETVVDSFASGPISSKNNSTISY